MTKYTTLIWAILILTLVGCTTTKPYRTLDSFCAETVEGRCENNLVVQFNKGEDKEYELAFLEYDDQGQLHFPKRTVRTSKGNEPRGVSVVFDRIRRLAENENLFLVTYVHGWHHNANNRPENSDVKNFKKLLEEASSIDDRRVFGVFVGWRGRSLNGPLDYLTFWDRKATAHEVGYQGITEALLEIEAIVKEGKPNNRMVTIGHSFGGAAIYSALHSVMAERYVKSRKFKEENDVSGFGDLVILMNPAFESLRYASLFDLAQDGCKNYPSSQKPRLVILSSYDDFPVSRLFNIGRLYTKLTESHRNTSTLHCKESGAKEYPVIQAKADRIGVGHYYPYVTHELDSTIDKIVARLPRPAMKIAEPSLDWEEGQRRGSLSFKEGVLISKGITKPFNPYMNIITDEGVVSGHSDIWNIKVKSFVYSLLRRITR